MRGGPIEVKVPGDGAGGDCRGGDGGDVEAQGGISGRSGARGRRGALRERAVSFLSDPYGIAMAQPETAGAIGGCWSFDVGVEGTSCHGRRGNGGVHAPLRLGRHSSRWRTRASSAGRTSPAWWATLAKLGGRSRGRIDGAIGLPASMIEVLQWQWLELADVDSVRFLEIRDS